MASAPYSQEAMWLRQLARFAEEENRAFKAEELNRIADRLSQLERDLAVWNGVQQSARTNEDHAVIVRFIREGEWSYLHGDPTEQLERELEELEIKVKCWQGIADQRAIEVADLQVAAHHSSTASEKQAHEWLIWSNEHRAWWGPGRCGYPEKVSAAGRYTLTEARDICRSRHWADGVTPPETMIHESEVAYAVR